MIRFFLDAIDGLHGVGEPTDAQFRQWENRKGRKLSAPSMRLLQGYTRGYKFGKLVGSACVFGSLVAFLLGSTMSGGDLIVRWIGVAVFNLASPHVLGKVGFFWVHMTYRDDDDDDDDDFDDPAPMGGV